jgi:predicted nucleotidyltransferase
VNIENKKSQQNDRWEAVREYLSGDPVVLLAYLFGSQATGHTGPTSDYDLGVLVNLPSVEIRGRLSHDLARILESDRIDVILLNRAPVELAYSVITQGQLIFE